MSDVQGWIRDRRWRLFGLLALGALGAPGAGGGGEPAAGTTDGVTVETDRSRGERFEGVYRDGLREGIWRLYGARRKLIREESFLRGTRDGPFIAYAPDGRIIALVNYREGKRHGTARFHFGNGCSLLATYRDGEETSRRLLGPGAYVLRDLRARPEHPIVSVDNWDELWARLDAKAPREARESRGGWSLRVVISGFRDARSWINPHLLPGIEGDLFRDMLSSFTHNVCRSAGRAWCTVLGELGAELTEDEEKAIVELYCAFHDRLSNFEDGFEADDREYHALLYWEFLEDVQKRLSDESFALLAVFLESVNLPTRDSRAP